MIGLEKTDTIELSSHISKLFHVDFRFTTNDLITLVGEVFQPQRIAKSRSAPTVNPGRYRKSVPILSVETREQLFRLCARLWARP